MPKAPEFVGIGCNWYRDPIKIKEGECIVLNFGKGDRNRDIRYTIIEVRKNDKKQLSYIKLKRGWKRNPEG